MAPDLAQTIILVDDEPDILDTHARLLQHGLPGVRIVCASNAEAALEQMALHDVDIVVSDLQMPGMDGIELLGECQRMAPDVYRVLVTAFAEAAHAHAAKDAAQIEEVLSKPVDPPAFIAMLQGLLDERAEMRG